MLRKQMYSKKNTHLNHLGFSTGKGSTHTKRTMMLRELTTLLETVSDPKAPFDDYKKAIIEENCLGKPSMATRRYTAAYLKALYALDPKVILFRTLRYFWDRDLSGRPLIAFLCAFARDPILTDLTHYVLALPEGRPPSKHNLEDLIEQKYPGRFSPVMKSSLGRRMLSSWTQAGFLHGRNPKIRSQAVPTAGSTSYALLLAFLRDVRGPLLFETEYARLLDCSSYRAVELAEEAARRGWIVFSRVGDVMEVSFPNFLNSIEMERIREQN